MYAGQKISQVRAEDYREAKQFVQMIKQEEQDFMTSVGGVLRDANRANTTPRLRASLDFVGTGSAKRAWRQSIAGSSDPASRKRPGYLDWRR